MFEVIEENEGENCWSTINILAPTDLLLTSRNNDMI